MLKKAVETVRHAIISAFKRTLEVLFSTIGVIAIGGFLIGLIESGTNSYLFITFGWLGILFTGLLGTPLHEFGHYIMCKIFGIRVVDVALFRPFAARHDGVLGYVRFSYNHDSIIERIGCFFVGIAPIVTGIVILLIALRLLLPNAYKSAKKNINIQMNKNKFTFRTIFSVLSAGYTGFFSGIKGNGKFTVPRAIIFFYIAFSISTHMSLSTADLNGASIGLFFVVVASFIISSISLLLRKNISNILTRIAFFISMFMSIGIAFSLLAYVSSYLIFRIL